MRTFVFNTMPFFFLSMLSLCLPLVGGALEHSVAVASNNALGQHVMTNYLRLYDTSIRFSASEIYYEFDTDGDAIAMFERDNAYWVNFKDRAFQTLREVNYRHPSWGSGQPGGRHFFESMDGIDTSIFSGIGNFDFSDVKGNKEPDFLENPKVTLRKSYRISDSPFQHLLFDPFNRPFWTHDFMEKRVVNEKGFTEYVNSKGSSLVKFDSIRKIPIVLVNHGRDDEGKLFRVRTVELDDYVPVDGYLIPTKIRVIKHDSKNSRPIYMRDYFIIKETIKVGPDVAPIFPHETLIPIGARVVDEITNETYTHYGATEDADAADAVGDFLRGLLDE